MLSLNFLALMTGFDRSVIFEITCYYEVTMLHSGKDLHHKTRIRAHVKLLSITSFV